MEKSKEVPPSKGFSSSHSKIKLPKTLDDLAEYCLTLARMLQEKKEKIFANMKKHPNQVSVLLPIPKKSFFESANEEYKLASALEQFNNCSKKDLGKAWWSITPLLLGPNKPLRHHWDMNIDWGDEICSIEDLESAYKKVVKQMKTCWTFANPSDYLRDKTSADQSKYYPGDIDGFDMEDTMKNWHFLVKSIELCEAKVFNWLISENFGPKNETKAAYLLTLSNKLTIEVGLLIRKDSLEKFLSVSGIVLDTTKDKKQ